MRLPKMTKYNVVVITAGTSACVQMRKKRVTSLRTMVARAMSCTRTANPRRRR